VSGELDFKTMSEEALDKICERLIKSSDEK